MTEQTPSAEAMQIAERIGRWDCTDDSGARAIDALIAQRVSAEIERCVQIAFEVADEDFVQSGSADPKLAREIWAGACGRTMDRIRAPAERPAPTGEQSDFARCLRCVSHELTRDVCGYAGRCVRQATASPSPTTATDYTSVTAGGIIGCWEDKWEIDASNVPEGALDDLELEVRRALSAVASERDAALHAAPSPSVVDYTERARKIAAEYRAYIGAVYPTPYLERLIADALSAVASERDAAAMRAFGERVWSDTEEVAYQAGAADLLTQCQEQRHRAQDAEAETMALLSRLRGPDDAMIGAIQEAGRNLGGPMPASIARAVIAKIAEMLT